MGQSIILGPVLLLWIGMTAMADEVMEPAPPVVENDTECVILLHGLARTPASMKKMAKALQVAGFETINEGYDSRHHTIEELSATSIPAGLTACDSLGATRVHFVTHSLGGILVRHYLSINRIENLGRVVMLGPPNQGSEVVDALVNAPGFEWINGPAGMQLGTGEGGLPRTLGRADFELGVIAGDRSINLINSTMIPGKDDGKISLSSTRLDGMTDYLVVHHTHPFIMKAQDVIEQTIGFLRHGCFEHPQTETDAPSCPTITTDPS